MTATYLPLGSAELGVVAETLGDIEATRISNENRLRQLVRVDEDSDGETRGLGLPVDAPGVSRIASIVAATKCDSPVLLETIGLDRTPRSGSCCLEHAAERALQKTLREHPLAAWCKAQRGIGEKQAARLLAAVGGDPYVVIQTGQPRTVSQLWAYCGYHVLPVSQRVVDTHLPAADGTLLAGGDPSQASCDTHRTSAGVAARRQKGKRANWSADAKMRAHLVAVSCMKSGGPYRDVYDKRKANTEGRTHVADCVRCGPSGKPALAGSEWSDGHRHADALRVVAKEILKDLWREARRLHEGDTEDVRETLAEIRADFHEPTVRPIAPDEPSAQFTQAPRSQAVARTRGERPPAAPKRTAVVGASL